MTAANPDHPDDERHAATCAAKGDPVEPIAATDVQPDMTAWHNGEWMKVKFVTRLDRSILIDFITSEPGATACRIALPDTRLFRRVLALERGTAE